MVDSFCAYLTHSGEDEEWGLVCSDAGTSRIPQGSPYPLRQEDHPAGFRTVSVGRKISEYQMVYLLSGRGILETLNRCWDIETGNLFLLFPGVRHAYRPDPKTGWTETWVGFRGPHADRLLTQGIISPKDPVHRPGYHSQLVEGFESILDLARVQAPLHQFRIGARILSILAETLSLERMSAQQSRAKEIVEAAKAFLESRIQLAFDLNGLCDQLSLSPAFLTNVFKDYTGMTPYQFCLHAKINRAKVILSGGECSVKEIAWKVGFEDQFYFSRLFKKKTGYSPTQWMALQAGVS